MKKRTFRQRKIEDERYQTQLEDVGMRQKKQVVKKKAAKGGKNNGDNR